METLGILQDLDKRGVAYRFLDNPNIDTTTTAGRLITAIFAEVSFAFPGGTQGEAEGRHRAGEAPRRLHGQEADHPERAGARLVGRG